MMKMVAALALISTSVPAQADWQFTRWGMSPAKIIAASKNKATRLSDQESKEQSPQDGSARALLEMPYQAGSFDFTATFMFDAADRLTRVTLYMKNGARASAFRMLGDKYGPPLHADDFAALHTAHWIAGPDSIDASVIGDVTDSPANPGGLVISYSPSKSSESRGL